ncbi:MAG: tetratricopeptide repeat protein [Alkalispirochaetaceae bacterium]
MENQRQDERTDTLLQRAYERIKEHELDDAAAALEEALSTAFENPRVVTSLKYVNFWRDRHSSVASISGTFDRAEYLLGQWRTFDSFVERIGERDESCLYALKQHVFGEALAYYRQLYQQSEQREPDLLLRIGRCYKGMGDFQRAVRFLQAATTERPADAAILAELADSFALVGDSQAAKAFFREAFFVEPQRVDVTLLESEMIRRLVVKLEEMGMSQTLLKEWLPVYGVLFGVFTVKRELRSIEFGRLKQAIYSLERELREGTSEPGVIEPRLINKYFWLIDHFIGVQEEQQKIDEVLLKIRSINSKIYHLYTN